MENLLLGLACIVTLGVLGQWLAWRLNLPAILLLLVFGFAAGPVAGFLKPDALFGDLLIPIISFSVALILFEGGLSLKISELKQIGTVLRNLITIGALVTWVVTALASFFILKLGASLSVLLGAILIVTGPTVIIPILRQLRLRGRTDAILKWEGIVIDPIGAMVSVLVFEAILTSGIDIATLQAIKGVITTIAAGGLLGWFGAWIIIQLLKHYWTPDYLQNPISFMMVLAVFVSSNFVQNESGLLAATVMGIILANQKQVSIKHIIAFKENLRVLLISSLFIILAARLEKEALIHIQLSSWIFLGVLILIARPLSIWFATRGSDLKWKEKLFLAFMAPRGIVAAAVASVFALKLSAENYPFAAKLLPLTFLVITGTVFLYGLLGPLLARWLKLSNPNPQGLLIVGAHSWARALAKVLLSEGVRLLLVDTNPDNIRAARLAGIPAYFGNALSEESTDKMDLDGIGRLIALTPNDEVNSIAAIHFIDPFERAEVFQLAPKMQLQTTAGTQTEVKLPQHLSGRILFGKDITFAVITDRFEKEGKFEATEVTKEFDFEAYKVRPKQALPLFLISPEGTLQVFARDKLPKPLPGQTLVSLVNHVPS